MSDPILAAFGQQISSKRLARGWTQASLAAAARVPVSDVCKYERARAQPGLTRALRIAAVLGISLDGLLPAPEQQGAA